MVVVVRLSSARCGTVWSSSCHDCHGRQDDDYYCYYYYYLWNHASKAAAPVVPGKQQDMDPYKGQRQE